MLNLNHSPASFLTQKYHSVDTRQLLEAFQGAGFNVASEGKATLKRPLNPISNMKNWNMLPIENQNELINKFTTRLDRYNARLGHEKHFMRLQSNELKTRARGHDLFLRVSNSYDGTSSLRVSLDILRLVCLNGMVAPRSIFEIAVRHSSKNIYNDAIEASYKILAKKEVLDAQIEAMSSKVLNSDEKLNLIDKMMEFRFGETSEMLLSPRKKLELLQPKRIEENNDNLYQNFNTLQEKLTKGSKIWLLDENGREMVRTVREVKSQITSDTFNDNSWNFAASLVA
jgi:hypothetical protein